jgi:hypothetical protein
VTSALHRIKVSERGIFHGDFEQTPNSPVLAPVLIDKVSASHTRNLVTKLRQD